MGSTPADTHLKTFPLGGIHPADQKLSADLPVRTAPLPKIVFVPLSQHIGVPARPVVKPGDKVLTGQLIAEAGAFVSAHVHAPVSGTVKRIEDAPDVSGYKKPAIVIETEGDDWSEQIDRTAVIDPAISLPPQRIMDRIKAAGIVGLGGAAFPTHVKLSVGSSGKPPEYLLVNGVECEPFLTSDHRLMVERPEEMILGILLVLKATGVRKAMVGIEANKMDAIDALSLMARKHSAHGTVEVHPLKMAYPQGGERQLVKALTNREIPPPPKGLPIDVGCIVINVATALAIYEAVQKNKPLIERVVTVTGPSVKNPGNFLVRLGTPVRALIDLAGGLPEDTGKITAGGPMMGRAFADLDTPLVKGIGGIVLYPASASKRGRITNCIRCGKCVSVCPLGLEPYLIAALAEKGNFDKAADERIVSCCDCGCCAYICPARRPLTDYIKMGKAKVLDQMRTKAGK